MTESIDDSQTEAAHSTEEEWAPKAFDRATFLAIPFDRRKEAAKRAAFLIARGLVPSAALTRAQSGMLDDETMRERPVDWELVAELVDHWKFPHRNPDGHPKEAVLDAADHLRALIEAVEEGHVASFEAACDQLREFCPNDESLSRALDIYCHYSGVRSARDRVAQQAEEVHESDDATDRDDDLPGFADEPPPDDPDDYVNF